MSGFDARGLDESQFGENGALKAVRAFDAFPKTKPSYTQRTTSGGVWTVVLICASVVLAFTELQRWWGGDTTHAFAVEQGVAHDLQINLDVVVRMKCDDLHVNVQDASGDRILAGWALNKDLTTWDRWQTNRKSHSLGATKQQRLGGEAFKSDAEEYKEEDVHDYLAAVNYRRKKFKKTPKVSRGVQPDSCRIYGSVDGNKVQGDFHITARGHGYVEMREHLDHDTFNFSHHINELSFGPFYPTLINPLDNTFATTETHFQKFQYFLSIVPTIYTTDPKSLRQIDKYSESPSSGEDGLAKYPWRLNRHTVFTNQYAVTEQSYPVPENNVPGIFVKYDIEPIQLTIAEEWSSLPALFIRIVNVISGVVVAGGWCFQMSEWAKEVVGRRRRRNASVGGGVLDGGLNEKRSS